MDNAHLMYDTHGKFLRNQLRENSLLSFIGVYDVYSASIAARSFDGLFLSGFSFAASFYGLPDIGFICWSDLVAFTQRVRTILPHHMLVVDIDDGFGDKEIACHVVSMMETVGASAIIMEDQNARGVVDIYQGNNSWNYRIILKSFLVSCPQEKIYLSLPGPTRQILKIAYREPRHLTHAELMPCWSKLFLI